MNYGKLTAGTTKTAIDTAKPSEKGEIITYLSRMGDVLHCELKRRHDILRFGIEIVGDGDIMDPALRKELLGIIAGLPHITPQTGKVFGYDHICFPGL